MRALRHLIPSFPLYGWIPAMIMLRWEPQQWFFNVGFVTGIAEVFLFYPYLSAWKGRVGWSEQLPPSLAIILGVCHWLAVYGICFFFTRRLANRTAILSSLGIMAASVGIAYLILGGFGYTVGFFIE